MASVTGGRGLAACLDNIVAKIESAGTLYVGFLQTETYPDGTPVALVAYRNEYGTTHAPPRPFFRRMIAAKEKGWGVSFGRLAQANQYDFEKTLQQMGMGIKDQLTTSIVEFTTPKNAAATVAIKGFDKPLIDTGQMQRATGFEVRDE